MPAPSALDTQNRGRRHDPTTSARNISAFGKTVSDGDLHKGVVIEAAIYSLPQFGLCDSYYDPLNQGIVDAIARCLKDKGRVCPLGFYSGAQFHRDII